MTYTLTLFAESPILIDGQHSSLTVDKSTARKVLRSGEDDTEPFIPASALKGALRIEFERLLRNLDPLICQAPDPQNMCADPARLCLACRLFGGPNSQKGKLRFQDAHLQYLNLDVYTKRMGVSLSRQLRKVEGKKLYSQEAAPANLMFSSVVSLLDVLSVEEQDRWEKVLEWCQIEGLSIGANRSRGMGRLAVHVTQYDEPEFTPLTFAAGTNGDGEYRGARERKVYRVSFTQPDRRPEPLRLSPAKTGTYLLKSLDFLPGSTMRGAAAWGWTAQGLPKDQVSDLILRHTRFSHLYPSALADMRPASAVRCKRRPDNEKSRHDPFDTLLLRFLLHSVEQSDHDGSVNTDKRANEKIVTALWNRLDSCPICDAGFKPDERFARKPERQLMIKLGMNRARGTAEEHFFYIYETLSPQTTFYGFLEADEGIGALPDELPVLVGGARGKGFGKGVLVIEDAGANDKEAPGDSEAIEKRARTFQRRLQELAVDPEYNITLPQDRWYFSLMLLTDLVLPPGMTLEEILWQEGWTWELAQVGWTRLGGYNETANQSKPLVPMLERGGVVLLSVPDERDAGSDRSDIPPSLLARLVALETKGMGLLREQGFGWVYSNHDFHGSHIIPKQEKADGTTAS